MKLLSIVFVGFFCFRASADEAKPLDFEEVFNLIRTNVSDVSERELRQNAAMGLIQQMGTRVQLVRTNAEPAVRPPDSIPKRAVYEKRFGYIRIRSVDERLPSDFRQNLSTLIRSNKLSGLVLDLRYAEGTNYEASAEVCDQFVGPGQELLKLGGKEIKSTDATLAGKLPVAVLVNAETRAGGEAIAAMLKESASALLIGSKTAGEARLFEVFTLSTGQKLRVGKVPIEVGGGKVIPAEGVKPDVEVTVAADEEKLFYQDPYHERRLTTRPPGSDTSEGTNRIRRLNEAELVRRHREGFDFSEEDVVVAETPVIMDPALSRAIDFLKGITRLKARPGF